MNTEHKPALVLECWKCNDVFMVVGRNDTIRLAERRKPNMTRIMQDLMNYPLACPKHRTNDHVMA